MVRLLLSIVTLGTRAESATTQLLYGANRRTLQTAVSTVDSIDSLTNALVNTDIGHIVLDPGAYVLSAELSITRSVILEAAVAGSVVLDAQASVGSPRRVLNINPGTSGIVQINGLNITGGNVPDLFVLAAETCNYPNALSGGDHMFVSHVCLQGGGVLVESGTVAFYNCQVFANTAAFVRTHVQNFPSRPYE